MHNEKLSDLLGDEADAKKLDLRLGRDGHPFVEGASWRCVRSADEAEGLIEAASRRRVTADNGLNDKSSRSHLVMTYQLIAASTEQPAGQLTLVDLAGSERLSRTEATGALAAETAAINKSLSALGDVMTAIGAKEAHVPYRNSKLTYLLQPALSKGARVMFIIAASPDAVDAPETLVSLGFGTRARNAQLGQERKQAAAGATAAPTPARVPKTPDAGALTPSLGNKTPRAALPASPKVPASSPRPQTGSKRPVTPGSDRAVKRATVDVN